MDDVYENINDYNPRHYLIMKINNRRELKNIAINNSPDNDYKGFIEIYRECTKEPFNFLTMDTTLPPSDPQRFRKKFVWFLIKIKVTDQIKTLDRSIMQNKAQHDLDQKATKISALFSNNLEKYEYLAGEDLALKPSTVEQAKFKYSPLGKFFTKWLDKNDQKEGLFKRIKNIERKIKGKN